MEYATDILNWLWIAVTDESITGAIKPRMIFFGMLLAVIRYWVKRTPSDDDDKLMDELLKVLPMIKRRK